MGVRSGRDERAAFRTVHGANVGSPSGRRLDGFWSEVYAKADLEDPGFSVRSMRDGLRLRPYFNTHLFAVDPEVGLLRH